jgi:hypothetical protein
LGVEHLINKNKEYPISIKQNSECIAGNTKAG